MEAIPVSLDVTAKNNAQWKQIMGEKLQTASYFEIHCWQDEKTELAMAQQYGMPIEYPWEGGTVVAGAVTEEFTQFLLNCPQPEDREIYNKMTPFFSIFLDNGFSSEHYGTELNQLSVQPS